MTTVAPPKLDKARALGMKDSEYARVVDILQREPTDTELAMFSVEWSEHCGYPRSRALLRLLPKTGKFRTLVGQDCGGVEIAPGLAVVFKMESHNHPSQVEPKQGAATGIGGIIRDIFTVGARPIALLDCLRFGRIDSTDPDEARLARYLFNGVVDGIQFYGNCIGVPTVGGDIYFNDCYRGNCLVGVMAIGVARTEQLAKAVASGPGNSVVYFGNSTGRDGIGGCSVLASHEFGVDDAKRPTVQLGDPFAEKCLIEATLEALATGAIVGIKDMGAAGLTCTTCETAAEGGVGMDIDLSKVPLREADMEPWEIMMSESQERMLAIVQRGREDEVARILQKWGLNYAVIGKVTDDGLVRIRQHGNLVAEMPAKALADPPLYDLPTERPAYLDELHAFDFAQIPDITPDNAGDVLKRLLASPSIASKEWVYQQYDHTVQTNTVVGPGRGDAAVVRLKQNQHPFLEDRSATANGDGLTSSTREPTSPEPTRMGLAATVDCNSRYCYLDPYVGAQIAIAEAARNLVCVGAEPAAVTDCLCFGNPEKPDRFYQFKRAVEGIADACKAFELPVVSGNVSFYNESADSARASARAVHPSPLIGMVGVLDDISRRLTMGFKDDGDFIVLIGETRDELGGSEYLQVIHGLETGRPPALDLQRERAVQQVCLQAAREGILKSAHDCSEGGLAVTLAECCIAGGRGAIAPLEPWLFNAQESLRCDAFFFGESQSRIVVGVSGEEAVRRLAVMAGGSDVTIRMIGQVGGANLKIDWVRKDDYERLIDLPVVELEDAWRNAIPRLMQ